MSSSKSLVILGIDGMDPDVFRFLLEHWCGDHCCDPSFVPGVLFGANLNKSNIDLPDIMSGQDISSIIENWLNTDKGK